MIIAEPQRISLFFPSFRGGGAERAMLVFGNELVRRGFSVDLVVNSSEGPLGAIVNPAFRVVNLSQSRMSRSIVKLARYLRAERPAALYSTIVHANVAAMIAKKISGSATKIIVRESNVPISEPKNSVSRWVTFKLIPILYPAADGIIAVSEIVAQELITLGPKMAKRLTVVATPVVEPSLFEQAEQAVDHPWVSDGGPPIVLGAARFQPHKGLLPLVRAFAEARKVRECRLILLGEGPQRQAILDEVRNLGIEQYVSLPGFSLNPFAFMRRAQVFVLASEYEGMPNVLVQAMAVGTPVVATDCKGGSREILGAGARGELVPVGDVPALARAILKSLDSPRREDSAAYVREHFGVERAASAYLAVAGLPMTATLESSAA